MSIQQPIKLPVTKFSSEDVGAPQISNAGSPGEIKTILKACLSTGFVDTEPAEGWSMPFEDGDKAVFRSIDPRSTGFYFKIDNNKTKGGQIACYEDMTDIDTGTKWSDNAAGFVPRDKAMQWRLFATPVAFLFICLKEGGGSTAVFFGDMMSAMPADLGNCFCYHPKLNDNAAIYYTDGFIRSGGDINRVARLSNGGNGAEMVATSLAQSVTAYKNIAGDKIGYPLYFNEYKASEPRLFSPFLLCDKREKTVSGFETINGREYFATNIGMYRYWIYLIPTDFWLL